MARVLRPERQCTATSKRTGQRCRDVAIVGGRVCWKHGGARGQVRRKAAQRAALAAIAADLPDLEHVDPSVVLGDSVALARAILAYVWKKTTAGGSPSLAELDALGVWLDRANRLAKTSADAGVAERRVRVEEAQLQLVAGAVRAIVTALGHDPTAPAVVRVIEHELRALDVAS